MIKFWIKSCGRGEPPPPPPNEIKSPVKSLHLTCMTKYPSRKVINFRNLLGFDTIVSGIGISTDRDQQTIFWAVNFENRFLGVLVIAAVFFLGL